jgi:hypothetical protein
LSNGCATGSKQQAWNLRKVERECAERRRRDEIIVVLVVVVPVIGKDGELRTRRRTRTNAAEEYR